MFIYWVYLLTFFGTSSYCFAKDYIYNDDEQQKLLTALQI